MCLKPYLVLPWDGNLKRTFYLDIWNAFNRHFYQESYDNFEEDVLDYYFGKGQNIPTRYLSFQNDKGDIVGYAGLSNFNGDVKTWRIDYGIYPQYFEKGLPRLVITSALQLARESDIPTIMIETTGVDNPFDAILHSHKFTPIHYKWKMELRNFTPTKQNQTLEGTSIRFQEKIENYNEYISVYNAIFEDSFEFTGISVSELEDLLKFDANYINHTYYMAYDKERLIGICSLNQEKNRVEYGGIAGLGVLPKYQNHGIGTRLLEMGVDYMLQAHVKNIALSVDGDNEKAMNIYKKVGFEVIPRYTQKFYLIKNLQEMVL